MLFRHELQKITGRGFVCVKRICDHLKTWLHGYAHFTKQTCNHCPKAFFISTLGMQNSSLFKKETRYTISNIVQKIYTFLNVYTGYFYQKIFSNILNTGMASLLYGFSSVSQNHSYFLCPCYIWDKKTVPLFSHLHDQFQYHL